MELVYRQALIWVAALYVPLIYPIGVVAHVSVFFVKYLSFRGLYKAPLKPFSRTKVTRLFLSFAFASLLAVVLPFSSAMVQTANSFCGPLRARECALLPHNETCGVARLNYDALNDELMTGSEVSFSSANISAISGLDGLASAAGSLATNLSSCGFSCVLKFFIDAIFSTATLLVVSVPARSCPNLELSPKPRTLILTLSRTPTLTRTLSRTPAPTPAPLLSRCSCASSSTSRARASSSSGSTSRPRSSSGPRSTRTRYCIYLFIYGRSSVLGSTQARFRSAAAQSLAMAPQAPPLSPQAFPTSLLGPAAAPLRGEALRLRD